MIFDPGSLNKLFRYCLALCGERDDADDLLQDCVEKYLSANTSKISNHLAFVKRVARNRFFDIQRRNQRVQFDVIDDVESLEGIERELESVLIDELTLKKLWSNLSTLERETVFLWAVEGMSATEIAAATETPRATILSRLRRIRLRLGQKRDSSSSGGG